MEQYATILTRIDPLCYNKCDQSCVFYKEDIQEELVFCILFDSIINNKIQNTSARCNECKQLFNPVRRQYERISI